MEWSTACLDWERRILAGESLIALPPLFPEEAKRALTTFGDLRIRDLPGRPTIRETARPWMMDFAASIFGAYDPVAERQLIREYLLLVSKKNGKSTIAAGIMMTALILNPRESAEFLILAPTKEVADNSFDPAADMAESCNDELKEAGQEPLFRVYRREKRIVHLGTRAELKVIAADTDTVTGTKATVVLVDELWVFGKRGGAMSMLREAAGGLASRPEGYVIYLSTMADSAPAGVFKSKLDEARKVRDGEVNNPRFLPVIYEFPERMLRDKSYRDPDWFFVTNPNLGASVDRIELVEKFHEAERDGEASLRDFEAKRLNVPIVVGLTDDTWAGAQYWDRGVESGLALDALLACCEVVIMATDGGGLDDLFGVAVLGREKETRRWLLWSHAFVSPEGMERRKANASIYADFIRDGDLTVVNGLPDDVAEIVAIAERIKDAGLLAMFGVDPAGLGGLVEGLAEIEITEDNGLLKGVPQGIRLMNAAKTVERKLVDGTFKHGGSRMMAWCAGNAKVRQTSTAMMIERAASGFGKIDPLMAAFDAAALMSLNPEAMGASIYETRELEFF